MTSHTKLTIFSLKSVPFRREFTDARKARNENASQWLSRVRELAIPCAFGTELDAFILDKFIVGLHMDLLQRLCSKHKAVSIDECLTIVERYEADNKLKVYGKKNQKSVSLDAYAGIRSSDQQKTVDSCADNTSIIAAKVHDQNGRTIDNCKKNNCSDSEDESDKRSTKLQVYTETDTIESLSSAPPKQVSNSFHVPKDAFKFFECYICHFRWEHECDLRRHLQIHYNEKSFMCHICGKAFNVSNYLKNHMKVHTDVKLYPCKECQKSFASAGHMKRHLRTHTGERPFTCSICSKKYRCKDQLNTHIRVHTGERPYQCNICKKRFCQSSSPTTHRKIH